MSISKLAYIHPDARLGRDVTVEPFASIAGDVEVGDGSWIGPRATPPAMASAVNTRFVAAVMIAQLRTSSAQPFAMSNCPDEL